MTTNLKWKMEQIWKTGGCIAPNHLIRWFDHEVGYRFYDSAKHHILLWFDLGTRRTSTRGCKPKGKGFSFLPKTHRSIKTDE